MIEPKTATAKPKRAKVSKATPNKDAEAPISAEEMARRRAAIALLQSWRDVDEAGAQEQRETYDCLEKALNEDRLSYRRRI